MKKIFSLIIMVLSSTAVAQYNMQWYSVYDNPHPSYNDLAVGLVQDNLGNIYITGTSFQIDILDDWRYDFATIKYSPDGDSLWVRRYDSSIWNESEDDAVEIGIDAGNNIYVTGNSSSPYPRISTIKYDSQGNQLWLKEYRDSAVIPYIEAMDMRVDSQGNVFLLGSRYGGFAGASEIIKYNTNGNIQWIKTYLVQANDVNKLSAFTIDTFGNIIAAGCIRSSGATNRDFVIVKYSPDGNLLWSATAHQTDNDISNCVKTDKLGNIYVAGYSETTGNRFDFKLIKYNTDGVFEWIKSYPGRSYIDLFNDYGKKNMIEIDREGNIYVNFSTFSSANSNDIAIAKYSQSGELKWINEFNIGVLATNDIASDIKLNNSNGIFVSGYSKYETSGNSFVILIYDTSGSLQKVIRNENQFVNVFSPVALAVNGQEVVATGSSLQIGNPFATDYFTVKYSASTDINIFSNSMPFEFYLHQNYPNPFNPVTRIKFDMPPYFDTRKVTLNVYNADGKEVRVLVNQQLSSGSYQVEFDGSNLASGCYFYQIRTGDFMQTKKMVLIR